MKRDSKQKKCGCLLVQAPASKQQTMQKCEAYLFRNKINHWLVVDVVDVGPLDLFLVVNLFLELEGVVVEVLLEHLVCEINAQLFK